MDERHICAFQEVVLCMGEVLEPRASSKALAWYGNLKQSADKCDCTMSSKPHWWQRSCFFFTNSDCCLGVHWFVLGAVVEPAMHMFLWDAKGSEVNMRPFI